MAGWFDELTENVKAAGVQTRVWQVGVGRLLVTVEAARLLACELPGVAGNVFWHSPAMKSVEGCAKCFKAASGGLGGDRLWIAPEIAYMWTDLKEARIDPFRCQVMQKAMDPGAWRVADEGDAMLRLATTMELVDYRGDRKIKLNVSRAFSIQDPPRGLAKSITAFGLAIENRLAIEQADDGAVAGAWELLQLPPTGTLICPTHGKVEDVRSYYDPFGDRHVQADEKAVRFLIDSRRRIKMGIKPEETTGKMGYYRRAGDVSILIVREFQPQVDGPYVDLPRASDDMFGGDAVQAFNDSSGPGGFGEMEYHEPALVGGKGPQERLGRNTTCVAIGPDDDIRREGEAMLGVAIREI